MGGGTRSGYDDVKSPLCRPTCHCDDGVSEVALKSPLPPDVVDEAANTRGADPAGAAGRTADSVRDFQWLVVRTGVMARQCRAFGVVSAQAGISNKASREPKPPPAADPNPA